ncbi:hypothetical protein GOODEAATRI_024519, partial [Goodea atripinnis]
ICFFPCSVFFRRFFRQYRSSAFPLTWKGFPRVRLGRTSPLFSQTSTASKGLVFVDSPKVAGSAYVSSGLLPVPKSRLLGGLSLERRESTA